MCQVHYTRSFWFASFRNFFSEPVYVRNDTTHFFTAAVECFSVQASFKTIVHPFLNTFNRAGSLPEFWISRSNSSKIIAPWFGACIQVAVLAVHTIADMHYCSFGTKIIRGVCDQFSAVTDQVTTCINRYLIGEGTCPAISRR